MSMQRYARYADSGIPRLGEIPSHWRLSRFCFETYVRARLGWKGLKADEYVDDGYIFLATPNIKETAIDFDNVNYITQERYEESPEIMLRPNDVLLTKDGSTLGTVNVVRVLPREATVNSSIAVITPTKGMDGRYLMYYIKSGYVQNLVWILQDGMGVPHLFQKDINKICLLVPPVEEQVDIADYLDQQTAKINALLSNLQRQAEMLEIYKRELVAVVVTKGLDKSAPMINSGVDWLGQVPATWKLIKAKWLFRQRSTKGNESEVLLSATQKMGMLPQDEIRGTVKVKESTDLQTFKTVHMNDFVISLRSFQGGFEISEYEGVCSPAYQVFYAVADIFHSYFKRLFKSVPFIDEMNSLTTGIREGRNIPYEDFAQSLIPVPPMQEQQQIASYLDKRLALIDGLIADIGTQIEQLKAYRQIVIHDAVTGKIKVGGAGNGD